MKVKIPVTKKHISKGKRDHANQCPVALALRDKLKPRSYVSVYSNVICFPSKDIPTPKKASQFIDAFDDKKSVEPFVFSLDIPNLYIRSHKEKQ